MISVSAKKIVYYSHIYSALEQCNNVCNYRSTLNTLKEQFQLAKVAKDCHDIS